MVIGARTWGRRKEEGEGGGCRFGDAEAGVGGVELWAILSRVE